MGHYISYNGKIQPAGEAGGRDPQRNKGVFETMRIFNGNILFSDHHFQRLFNGMNALGLYLQEEFSQLHLKESILDLCIKNEHIPGARVRLTVYDPSTTIIESWELNPSYVFNEAGLTAGIYKDTRKTINLISGYKTTSYDPYALAAEAARRQGYNDCLVLNTAGNICDSSIANVFWIKDQAIYTPPYSEGCIYGGMRNYLVDNIPTKGFEVEERPLTPEILATAEEIFLTNVIRGIQPIVKIDDNQYNISLSRELFKLLIAPLTND